MNNIYYLGPSGSFSHLITQKINGEFNQISCRNFSEIISKTLIDINAIGILPIENSITSNVHENMDYLFKENLTVIAEAFLKIKLNLLGLKNSTPGNIKQVYSHPQALAQCAKYISDKNLAINPTDSTSSAKEIILKYNNIHNAIIGGKELIKDGRLITLDENIGDEKFNITRFLLIASNPKIESFSVSPKNKASIMFRVQHKPGSLAKILTELADSNFNLTKIESRPISTATWEYQFWIDVENDPGKEIDNKGLNNILTQNTKSYKIIGIYPSGKIYD